SRRACPADSLAPASLRLLSSSSDLRSETLSCQHPQDFLASNRQLMHAAADGVSYGVADGGYGWNDCRLAQRFRTERAIGIVGLDPKHFNFRRVEMSHHARAIVASGERRARAFVVQQLFVQSHADALNRAAFHLACSRERIDDASAIVRRDKFRHTRAARF